MLFPYVRQRIRARFCRLSETGTGMIASTFRKRKDMPPDGNSFTRVKFSVIRLYHRLFPLSIPFPKFFRYFSDGKISRGYFSVVIRACGNDAVINKIYAKGKTRGLKAPCFSFYYRRIAFTFSFLIPSGLRQSFP